MKSISGVFLAMALAWPVAAEESVLLPAVQVSATRQTQAVSESLFDISVIGEEKIQQQGFSSALDLLNKESGVQISAVGPRGTGQDLFLRGANSNQSLILLDGVPLNSLDMYGSPLRFLSVFDIARVEVLKGNASALYGANAVGGVVQLISQPIEEGLNAQGLVGYGTENARQFGAGLSGGNAQWRAKLNVNHEASRGFSAQRYATGRDADDDAFRNTGVGAGLTFLPTDSLELGMRFHHQKGVTHYDSGDFAPLTLPQFDDRAQFQNNVWQIYAQNDWQNIWQSTLRISGTLDKQRSFSQWNETGDLMQHNRQLYAWQNDVQLPLGKLLALVEYQKEKGKFANDENLQSPNNLAGMLGWNAQVDAHAWQLQARLDKHSVYKKHATFNTAYAYSFLPNWRVRLGYGTAFRAPTLYELYAENTSWGMFANPNLKPEKSKNAELALQWSKNNQRFSLTFFQQRLRDLIAYVTDSQTYQSAYQNVHRAKIKGISLEWNGIYNGWHTFLSYDFLHAKNEKTNHFLAKRAQHVAKTGVSYDFVQFLLGAELLMTGKRFNDNAQINKLGGFALLNLFGEYRLSKNARVNVRVNNVLDKRYEWALVGVDSQGKRYPYNTAGLNAFVSLRIAY